MRWYILGFRLDCLPPEKGASMATDEKGAHIATQEWIDAVNAVAKPDPEKHSHGDQRVLEELVERIHNGKS